MNAEKVGGDSSTLWAAEGVVQLEGEGSQPVSSGTVSVEDDAGTQGSDSSRLSLAPGTVVDGTYRVLREIGRGAMGVVVRAHDERLDRDVAIKLIRAEYAAAGFRTLFEQEARAMAHVKHPNVVPIFSFGEHCSIPYFVMEFIEGRTLEDYIDEHGSRVDPDVAVRILSEVCLGVAAIHEADTLHRDIKPSNILLDANLHPSVTDFGVSVSGTASLARRKEIVGTPAYMAPEMTFPKPGAVLTPLADVYSLGCVAYELLTGSPPFAAVSGHELMMLHGTRPVPLPRSIRPDLPEAYEKIVMRALEKDPAVRTASAAALGRELLGVRSAASEPERILVAEDDASYRQLLCIELEREFPNARVDGVANGVAVFSALSEGPASVAILDLNMPGIDGIKVTELLRSSPDASPMPIIVLTGSGGPSEWRRLQSMGADRFLVKPVNMSDLTAAVRSSLRERAAKG
jgi:eukaryotic-like serine/threonine-protein kinase